MKTISKKQEAQKRPPQPDKYEVKLAEKKPDPEKAAPSKEYLDAKKELKFPPPKQNPIFVRKWSLLLDSVVERDNFRKGHLLSLEILCDMYVEYEQISEFLRVNGQTYEADGRQGRIFRTFPQVGQMNKLKLEIRNYLRLLGLVLAKDMGKEDPDKDEWSDED